MDIAGHIHKVRHYLKSENEQYEQLVLTVKNHINNLLSTIDIKKLDTKPKKMIVLKESGNGFRKTQQVITPQIINKVKRLGLRYRNIKFLPKGITKDLTSAVSVLLQDFTLVEQKGFKTAHNVASAVLPHRTSKTILELDGSSAFDTVPESFVLKFFKDILRLSNSFARFLTNTCCHLGFLYQGSPLSPIIYSIYQLPAIAEIKRVNGIKVTTYADDIIISTKKHRMTWDFRRFLIKILEENNIKINDKKTHFLRTDRAIKLGIRVKSMQVARKKYLKHKLRLVNHLIGLGLIYTKRPNKIGENISLNALRRGLESWLFNGGKEPKDKRLEAKIAHKAEEVRIEQQLRKPQKNTTFASVLGSINKAKDLVKTKRKRNKTRQKVDPLTEVYNAQFVNNKPLNSLAHRYLNEPNELTKNSILRIVGNENRLMELSLKDAQIERDIFGWDNS